MSQCTTTFIGGKPPKHVEKVAAKLDAGGMERCASCLKWINRDRVATIGTINEHDNAPVIVICKRCSNRAAKSIKRFVAMSRRVEKYIGASVLDEGALSSLGLDREGGS